MRQLLVGPGKIVGRIVTAAMVAAVVSACGGGGSSKAAVTPTSTSTSTAGGDPATGNFCDLLRTYSARLAGLSQATSSPDQVRTFADDLAAALKSAVVAAPAELKADITVLTGAADDYLTTLRNAGYDLAKLPPDAAQAFQAPDVAAAAGRLQIYSSDACGLRN